MTLRSELMMDFKEGKVVKMGQVSDNIFAPDACHFEHFKALIDACKDGDMDAVKQLVDEAGPLDRWIDDRSPLEMACANRNNAIASLLLAKGADPDFGMLENLPLLRAINSSNLDLTHLLLEAGADPNNDGGFEDSPLNQAACMGRVDIVIELLNHGGLPETDSDDGVLFYEMVANVGERLLEVIFKLPNWDCYSPRYSASMLHWLARLGSFEYLNEAIKRGVKSTSACLDMCDSLLHEACIGGNPDVVRAVLDLGEAAEVDKGLNWKPFNAAVEAGNIDAALVLVEHMGLTVRDKVQGKNLQEWFIDNPHAIAKLRMLASADIKSELEQALELPLAINHNNRQRFQGQDM
jgi:ankyrin repeat protein